MSFLDVLKKIGGVATGILPIAAPIVTLLNPAAGALLGRIQAIVIHAEQAIPADGQGPAKQATAIAAFSESLGLDIATEIFAARGETLTYDPSALTDAINAQVALFNAVAKLKSSFGTEKKA